MTVKITKENFKAEVLESSKPVVLDFWASWCGPCRMIAPILDTLAAERPDVKICKLNVDDEPELSAQYGISSIPTLLFIENGEVVDKMVGARPKEDILAKLP